jgi:hypothetical protein
MQGHRCNNKMFHPISAATGSAATGSAATGSAATANEVQKNEVQKNEVLEPELTPLTPKLIAVLGENFAKCVQGYHLLNNDPIKESPWEDINATVLRASGCPVKSQASGSHKSGADLSCSLGDFSNKSSQYSGPLFEISSYRLTTVSNGKIEDIIAEINRRKNFMYYSIIVRAEQEGQFHYDWYLIPSDLPELNPGSYTWRPSLGKKGKNKGEITGWETNKLNGSSMSITFSMSSQLWINLNITEEMKQYIIGSCKVDIGRKYNYIELYEQERQKAKRQKD